jgi:hypothetical protein
MSYYKYLKYKYKYQQLKQLGGNIENKLRNIVSKYFEEFTIKSYYNDKYCKLIINCDESNKLEIYIDFEMSILGIDVLIKCNKLNGRDVLKKIELIAKELEINRINLLDSSFKLFGN